MSESRWCELCRDHVEGEHWDEDGTHKSGAEFGPFGAMWAVVLAAVDWDRASYNADPSYWTAADNALHAAVAAYRERG